MRSVPGSRRDQTAFLTDNAIGFHMQRSRRILPSRSIASVSPWVRVPLTGSFVVEHHADLHPVVDSDRHAQALHKGAWLKGELRETYTQYDRSPTLLLSVPCRRPTSSSTLTTTRSGRCRTTRRRSSRWASVSGLAYALSTLQRAVDKLLTSRPFTGPHRKRNGTLVLQQGRVREVQAEP